MANIQFLKVTINKLSRVFWRWRPLAPNGPAIKGVSVAERTKAGAVSPYRGNVPVPAGRSEAWRDFCHPVASFLSFTSVAVQGLLGAGHLSPYTGLIESSGAVTVMSPYTVFSWVQGMVCKNACQP